MRLSIILFLFSFSFALLHAQNVGIGNTNPQSTFDLNGSLRIRSQVIFTSDNQIVLPIDVGNLIVVHENSVPFLVSDANPIAGRKLIIENFTGINGTIGGNSTTIPQGINEYVVSSNLTWELISKENINTWNMNGNLNTNPNNDFIGTIDSQPLKIKTQNTERILISENGNIGINTSTPSEKFDISGNIKTNGEIKPNGIAGQTNQVLTSNGNGTMQWASPASSEESSGSGTWGDCGVNSITAYQPVGNSNGTYNDEFGESVSISGDYAIAGAGDDSENGFLYTGSATIFKRNASLGIWESQVKLINPNAANLDNFGNSVCISGDYAIVGAYQDDEGAGLDNNGSATIFKRNTTTGVWESQIKLVDPYAASGDFFGYSVSISGDYAIVGAYQDDEGRFSDNGSATIFKRNTTTGVWESQGKIVNPSAANFDNFGNCVSISGDYAIVGAFRDDEGSGLIDDGSATIFKRNTTTGVWENQGKLIDQVSASHDQFGFSVSISGDYAVVGANRDDESGFTDNGSATFFKRNTSTGVWEYQIKLTNPAAESDDYFGNSVSISGDYVIVGAYSDDEGSGLTNNGSTIIFKRYGEVWLDIQKFTRAKPKSYEYFGTSVSIDGNTKRFLVGAFGLQSYKGLAFFGKVN